jgi:hypothetical protein|tara:strand:+ start:2750 stop:3292 length:543 start_codon:yes stop_codon:yes gene_type:complete
MLKGLLEEHKSLGIKIKGMADRNTPENKKLMYKECDRIGSAIVTAVLERNYPCNCEPIPYNLFKGDLKLSPNPFTEPDEICIEVKTETFMSDNLFMETSSNEETSAWIRTATKQPMILIHSYPDKRNKLILFDTEKLLPALVSGKFGRSIETRYNTTGVLFSIDSIEEVPGYIETISINK